MISSVTRFGTMALLAGVLLSSAPPASATLKPCYPALYGVGSGPTVNIAMKNAIKDWAQRALNAYGGTFAHYSDGEKVSRSCKETGGIVHCRIVVKPCKSG